MSLLPEDADWFERLQAFFLAFRGDGVSLSALDAECLRGWHEQGVPYEVVCRGIRKAAEALVYDGKTLARVRTLRGCRASVEREHRRWVGLSAGRPKESGVEAPRSADDYAAERWKKVRRQVQKGLEGAEPALRAGLEAALAALGDQPAGPREVARRVARADEALALRYLRGLPLGERRALVREARELAGSRRSGSSARARKDALRAHLVALVRSKKGLLGLA